MGKLCVRGKMGILLTTGSTEMVCVGSKENPMNQLTVDKAAMRKIRGKNNNNKKLEQINKNCTIEDNLEREREMLSEIVIFFGEKKYEPKIRLSQRLRKKDKKNVSAQKLIANFIGKMQQKMTLK